MKPHSERSDRRPGAGRRPGGPPFKAARAGPEGVRPRRAAPRYSETGDRSGQGWPPGVRLVHEDADLIVLDKPPGLLTATVGPQQTGPSLFDSVKMYLRRHRNRGGRVYIIHRLDREVSGLLVFAKTEKAFNWLKDDFRAKRVHRLYLALVEGEIAAPHPVAGGVVPHQAPSGTVQSFIHEDEYGQSRSVGLGQVAKASRGLNPRTAHPEDSRAPRLSVTHWRAMRAGGGYTLLQVRLETGRKNQVRIHMKEFGHPIAGDIRMGAKTDPGRRLALHAAELGFTHPGTGQSVRFLSPAPEGFYRAVGMEPPSERAPSVNEGRLPTGGMPAALGGHVGAAKNQLEEPIDPTADTGWDHVAEWYDELIDEKRSDHFEQVILPGTLRLLRPAPDMRVLDAACGQGELCRRLAGARVQAVGVDAAPKLIEAARKRSGDLPAGAPPVRYEVGDARELGAVGFDPGTFDAAACVMALMNINPLEPVLRGVAELLRPGGAFVAVILHPAFRAPRQTSWEWDEGKKKRGEKTKPAGPRQYRRVDGYLSPGQTPIVMNPGAAAHGQEAVNTWTFHRPIQTYIAALSAAGLLIDAMEEWPSLRTSQPGPRAGEENRARREIPLFLAIRAVMQAQ